jgi:Flp pilus assembly protein TadG
MARRSILAAMRRDGRGPRSARDRSGVTAVEFAMLLPLFMTLLFGIIEFAQVVFFQAALQHAVTAAARCASEFAQSNALGSNNTPPDCSSSGNIQLVAQQGAFGLNIPEGDFTPVLASNGYNCVNASFTFNLGVPFLPRFSLPLTASSCYPAGPASTQ